MFEVRVHELVLAIDVHINEQSKLNTMENNENSINESE